MSLDNGASKWGVASEQTENMCTLHLALAWGGAQAALHLEMYAASKCPRQGNKGRLMQIHGNIGRMSQ